MPVVYETVLGVKQLLGSNPTKYRFQVVDCGRFGWFNVYSALPLDVKALMQLASKRNEGGGDTMNFLSKVHRLDDYEAGKGTKFAVDDQTDTAQLAELFNTATKAMQSLGIRKMAVRVIFGVEILRHAKPPSGASNPTRHVMYLLRGKRSPMTVIHEWAHQYWRQLPKADKEWFKQWHKHNVLAPVAREKGLLPKGKQYHSDVIHNMRGEMRVHTKKGETWAKAAEKMGLSPSAYGATDYQELWSEAVAYSALKPNRINPALRKAVIRVLLGQVPKEKPTTEGWQGARFLADEFGR